MNLPIQYQWLLQEGAPKMVVEFIKIYGVAESPGTGDNPVIIGWAKEVGLDDVYVHDSTAWCGLEMAILTYRAGKEIVKEPLWALNWAKFGVAVQTPMLGDVLVFKRTGGGHVGIYIGQDDLAYHVAGGNEGDKSTIIRILKSRLYAARRPIYQSGQPANVRVIKLESTGHISTNEQ